MYLGKVWESVANSPPPTTCKVVCAYSLATHLKLFQPFQAQCLLTVLANNLCNKKSYHYFF